MGIAHPRPLEERLIAAASFASMKANAGRFAVAAGQGFWSDDADFFDSASSNKWIGRLIDDDLAAYDVRMRGLLTAEQRRWLEWGEAAG